MSPPTAYSESWLSGPKATQFYTRTYKSSSTPKAALVFVHGFAEHVGRYAHFHPLLSQHEIAVFAFDQRGFGKTALDTEGNKSKDSAYGKTSWSEQMVDISWAIEHARKTFSGVPTFLMGHSMGGAEVLGFATGQCSTSSLAGIISTSPLILQTKPAPKLMRMVGGVASNLFPNQLIPANVNAEDLSHDPVVNDAYLKDPLVKSYGSLRGLKDMLSNGEVLLDVGYKKWPKSLPLLLVHGTEDKVTSPRASQAFYDKVPAVDKRIKLCEGGYHELHNEPNGVKEQLVADIVAFIEAHLQGDIAASALPEERSKM
ncbi:putative serine hydrolase C5E4.05c [Termitomyces sp. J132]|nr:putative serine hydrolase C5E4.05c [Termitomyces sp. J132]